MRPVTETRMDSARGNPRLGIEVTTRCNSACRYCFAGAGPAALSDIPVEVVKNILAQGVRADYRHLHITGGEPLLYGDIFRILDEALDLGYETILLNTNGLLLTGHICRQLADYPGLSVTISLEGTQALHDRVRGQGSHQKVLGGLENALAAGMEIIVFATACKSLLPALPDFADFLMARFPGILYLTLIRLVDAGYSSPLLDAEFLDTGDFLDLVNMVSLINLYGLQTRLLNDPLINVVSRKRGMTWIPASQELDQGGNLMVMADLRVCASHSGRENYGAYAPGFIADIQASDQYRQATGPDMQVCPACEYVKLCRANGLFRPAKWHLPGQKGAPFCKTVIDMTMP
ncbi:MAG: radical SAM protein [Desulfobacterales bacterium]|nr:radical SAM protein [Desulfobacterales bacterium]